MDALDCHPDVMEKVYKAHHRFGNLLHDDKFQIKFRLEPGGRIIHEAGVTRMGHSADSSVLNAHCQAHDVKNLFVADGGPFVSQADKNLTWTIMALAMRTGEYIADTRNRGEL